MQEMQETQVPTWVGKVPWRRKWQLTPVFLPEWSHGQRSLAGYSTWGLKELNGTKWLSMHMYCWVPLLFLWNYHSIINWLYSTQNKKLLKKKKELSVTQENLNVKRKKTNHKPYMIEWLPSWSPLLFSTLLWPNQSILQEINLYTHLKDWCWNFSTLATWCEQLVH